MSEKTSRQNTGRAYEDLALTHLLKNQFKLIERNFFCSYGEIDLIVKKKKIYVFVEVRFKRNSNSGTAQESITRSKQKKIINTAHIYLQQHKLDRAEYRFDVFAFNGYTPSKSHMEWITNAFAS